MVASATFQEKFSDIFTLCNVFSVYLPTNKFINFFGFLIDYNFVFCVILMLTSATISFDLLAQVFFLDLGMLDTMIQAFTCLIHAWAGIRRLHNLMRRKQLIEFCKAYDLIMNPTFCNTTLLEAEFVLLRRSAKKMAATAMAILFVPLVLAGISKMLFSRTLFIRSLFQRKYSYESRESPLLIFFQLVFCYNAHAGWAWEEAFITLAINVLTEQFKYLEYSLKEIIDTWESSLLHESRDAILRKKMAMWVDHHVNVLKAFTAYQSAFAMLVNGEQNFTVIAGCGLTFCATRDIMPFASASLTGIYHVGHLVMGYRFAKCCDRLTVASYGLNENIFTMRLFSLPLDVQKNLLIISQQNQKPAEIKMPGFSTINSKKFMDVINTQYKFFTFIQNI